MTSLYTGQPYNSGHNNMTAQGCFHATVNYGSSQAKAVALEGLKALRAGDRNSAEILLDQLNTLEPQEKAMLTWALRTI